MRGRSTGILTIIALLATVNVWRVAEADPPAAVASPDAEMMHRYLLGLVDEAAQQVASRLRGANHARTNRRIPTAIASAARRVAGRLAGTRRRLMPGTTGRIHRDGYTVEKVIFESQPHFYVTGLMFLPDPAKFKPPYPGVVEPCGHSDNGKAYKNYQTWRALLALNGMAAVVFDPIDQGERLQSGWDPQPEAPDSEPSLARHPRPPVRRHQLHSLGPDARRG